MTLRERLRSTWWIPAAAIVAVLLARPGTSLRSTYAFDWYAVALVLVAVAGRRQAAAASVAALLGALGGFVVAMDHSDALLRATDLAGWAYVAGGLIVIGLSAVQLTGGLGRLRPLDPVVLAATQSRLAHDRGTDRPGRAALAICRRLSAHDIERRLVATRHREGLVERCPLARLRRCRGSRS